MKVEYFADVSDGPLILIHSGSAPQVRLLREAIYQRATEPGRDVVLTELAFIEAPHGLSVIARRGAENEGIKRIDANSFS